MYRALYFGLYDSCKNHVEDNLIHKMVLAFSLTNASYFLLYPVDITISLLMMQSGKPTDQIVYQNTRDCITKLYNSEGLKGFYKGSMCNLLRGFGSTIVLVMFDELKKRYGKNGLK